MKPLPGALAGLPNLWRGGQRRHAVDALPTGHARLEIEVEFAGVIGSGVVLDRLLWVRGGSPREGLWACEQALRDLAGGIVVAWPERPAFARLRRLQMAARDGGHAVFLFRPPEALRGASPAALRLGVEARGRDTHVTVHKCRGERPREDIRVRRAQVPGLSRLRTGPAVLTDGETARPHWPHEPSTPSRHPLLDRAAPSAPGAGPGRARPADAPAAAGGHRRGPRTPPDRH